MKRRDVPTAFASLALPACATPPSPDSIARHADALLNDLAARNLFQGAVVIGHGEHIDYQSGFGFADVARRIAFTPDTPSDGASITKTFTAAALLMLANGSAPRLDLEAPVRSLLPAYPHAATRLRHLLAHSAGLRDYGWFDMRVPPGEPRSNAMHLALLARDAPQPDFAPGSAYAYDNVAYDVAAMVLERIAGAPYADLVAELFARPLGLRNLFVRPARFRDWRGTRTRGYRRGPDGWKDHDAHDLEGFHGGGNIYVSARDLVRWMAGYHRVVGDAAYRAAIAPARLDDGRRTGLTLGSWYVSADRTQRYYTGHHNGFHNFGYADDARGTVIGWVANDAPPAWLQPALSRSLIAVAEGRTPEQLHAPPAADAAIDPSGRYRVPDVGDVQVRSEQRRLHVRLGGVEYQGFPFARGVHYVPGLDAYLRFAATPAGGVEMAWDSVFVVAPAVARLAP